MECVLRQTVLTFYATGILLDCFVCFLNCAIKIVVVNTQKYNTYVVSLYICVCMYMYVCIKCFYYI